MMQEEKEVLALLSKLDLDNIHFADSPPGMFTLNHICFGPRTKKCFCIFISLIVLPIDSL